MPKKNKTQLIFGKKYTHLGLNESLTYIHTQPNGDHYFIRENLMPLIVPRETGDNHDEDR